MPVDCEGLTRRLDRVIPYLYLVLSLVTTLFLAWNLPPFQGADEVAHFERADLSALGRLTGHRRMAPTALRAGGQMDPGIIKAARPFDAVRFHPETKVDAGEFAQAYAFDWNAPHVFRDIRGAVAYPPLCYLPAIVGIWVGKTLHQPIVQTLYLARMVQALACVLIGWLALRTAGRARLWLYAVLMLPMTLALTASVTADGLVIALAALGAALICRPVSEGRAMRAREVVWASLCFAVIGMTKAPYALFALALLVAPVERPRWRWIAVAAVLGVSFAWTAWTAAFVQIPLTRPDAVPDPGGQVRWLEGHLLDIPGLAVRTLTVDGPAYVHTIIGVLGWNDTSLPAAFYPLAWVVLALAAVASVAMGRARPWRNEPWVVVAIALAASGSIFLALYLTWTAVGAPVVDGVAGRYFVPIAAFLGLALEGTRPALPETGRWAGARLAVTGLVLAFPLLSFELIERAVILRYYLH